MAGSRVGDFAQGSHAKILQIISRYHGNDTRNSGRSRRAVGDEEDSFPKPCERNRLCRRSSSKRA